MAPYPPYVAGPRRSGADAADCDGPKVARVGSKPGGAGGGILPSGLIDRLFGGDGEVTITDERLIVPVPGKIANLVTLAGLART
jgi:hypothetical protein